MTVASILAWSDSESRLTERQNQYMRSMASAEAATEKVLGLMSADHKSGGAALVISRLNAYAAAVPSTAESSDWGNWAFTNPETGATGTYINQQGSITYTNLNSVYAGLKGFLTTYALVANARETQSSFPLVAGVRQEFQLAAIPIFQFAMFSSLDMEISCGQPFTIGGRVHSNKELYVEPGSDLTFLTDVTAVGNVQFARSPFDSRTPTIPAGTVTYNGKSDSKVGFLYLPIGTNNSPTAIREIINPAPGSESPSSAMGRQRYQNQAEMLVLVTNDAIRVTSGLFNSYGTAIPSNEVALFIKTNASFSDARESKTVQPIDIDIGALTTWSQTNANLRTALGYLPVSSMYVWDRRTMSSNSLGAVRVRNGLQLPPRGLTVATASPIYVWGHYNQPNAAHLGTTNTSFTLPASLVGDAITILSTNWLDANSALGLSSRLAVNTTVNAAIMAGNVETASTASYSGGMENFLRFLEKWGGGNQITYNGSMVLMYPSAKATNQWGKADVYDPPKRFWSFDLNFTDPARLPPLTPTLSETVRGQWTALRPGVVTP